MAAHILRYVYLIPFTYVLCVAIVYVLVLNYVRQKMKFRELVPMLIQVQICRLLERIRSVFSHIVRKDTSNLPKPSPQCQMVRLHKYHVFSLSIIILPILSSLYSLE